MTKNNLIFSPNVKRAQRRIFNNTNFVIYCTWLECLITKNNHFCCIIIYFHFQWSFFLIKFWTLCCVLCFNRGPSHGMQSITLHSAGTKPFGWMLNSSQLAALLLGLLAKSKHSRCDIFYPGNCVSPGRTTNSTDSLLSMWFLINNAYR